MEIVYIDLHFLINLLADYLLCLTAGRFCGLVLRRRRYFFAAFIGAVYSAAVLLPGLEALSSPFFKLLCAVLMGYVAFGAEEHPLRCTLSFLGISAAFGGALWAVGMAVGTPLFPLPLKTLALSFAICYAALSIFFRAAGKLPEKKRLSVNLSFSGRESAFYVLADTGNSLTDPISGKAVMLVCPHALKAVLPGLPSLTAPELVQYTDGCEQLKGRFRLIPYSAVGGGGLLAAFRPDRLIIDGKERSDVLIALCEQAHGEGFLGIF